MVKKRRRSACFAVITLMVFLDGAAAAAQSSAVAAPAQELSCSLPGLTADAAKAPTVKELLQAYNAQGRSIRSLHAFLMLHAQDSAELNGKLKNSKPFPAMLTFRSPASVRLTGAIPFSSRRIFDLASDGHTFELLTPEGKTMRLILGEVDAPATSPNPREDIRPQAILEAVRLLPARLSGSPVATPRRPAHSTTVDVELDASTGSVAAQLEFDLHSGTISRLSISGPRGNSGTEVDYSDWQREPDGRQTGKFVCFPSRILVTQPTQGRRLEFKFLSIEMNKPTPLSQFRFFPPPGVVVTRVGRSGRGSAAKP